MTQTYRLVGSQNPGSRIDRILVESPSEEYPEGKTLELGGKAVELSPEQVAKLSAHARLEPVEQSDGQVEPAIVDQPGVQRESLSTDNPPNLGTVPDFSKLNQDELYAEVENARKRDPQAAPGVNARSSKADLQQALNDHYGS